MTPDQIAALRQAVQAKTSNGTVGALVYTMMTADLLALFDHLEAMSARLEAVRAEALEEAVLICRAEEAEFMQQAGKNNGRESDFAFGSVNSAERIAAAIRAIATKGAASENG